MWVAAPYRLASPPRDGLAPIRARQLGFTRHPWLVRLLERKPTKVAVIALANKIARMIWALMMKNERFDPNKLMPAESENAA